MKKFVLSLFMSSFLLAVPAHAEDDTEKVGILALLGLTASDGKTEVSDKGAEIEGWLLASGTLAKAASKIAADAKPDSSPEKIILLSGDTKFDLGALTVANGNISAAIKAIATAVPACASQQADDQPLGIGAEAKSENSTRVAAAIIGALKVDSTVTGFDIGTPNGALLNLIAGHLKSKARIPSDAIGIVDQNSKLAADFGELVVARSGLERCSVRLPATTDAEKKIKAKVDAAIGAAKGVEDTLTAFDKDSGASLLNRALVAEPYLSGKYRALRVNVEKAGGNLITRRNIFLQLGFPGALSVSAGSIVSYRFYKPATGEIESAGMLICQAAERSWHSVQAGKIDVNDCLRAGEVNTSSKKRQCRNNASCLVVSPNP